MMLIMMMMMMMMIMIVMMKMMMMIMMMMMMEGSPQAIAGLYYGMIKHNDWLFLGGGIAHRHRQKPLHKC